MVNLEIAFALIAGVVTFLIGLLIGRPIIQLLRRTGAGKEINPWGPQSHLAKSGTPTMGGVMIVASVLAVTAAVNLVGRLSMLVPLGALLAAACLGYLDDRMTLVGRKSEGLTPRAKMAGLLLIAIAVVGVLYSDLQLSGVYVPMSRALVYLGPG
jgi:phospho-N-acetylmuramoyl-pentapeptide-transferase